MRRLRPVVLLAILVQIAACGAAAETPTSASAPDAANEGSTVLSNELATTTESEAPSEAPSERPTVEIQGQPVLTDSEGFTIYYFRKDEPGRTNCYEPCSDTWPPVPADEPIDTSDLDPSRVGSVSRDDGSEQLAFDGMPLYLFKDDVAPGQVKGQGVGNVWFAVATDGSEIGPKGGVRIGSTDAGDVLVNPQGFTLYTLEHDGEGTSNCDDPCTQTWQPVPADTAIDISLDDDQFDTIERQDGSEQLVLNGRPLYRYADDANPGDANGDAVGDVWFAVPDEDVELAEDDGGQVTVGHSELGPVLVDGEGKTLYAFTNDAFVNESEGQSNCNDTCAQAWPPVPGGVAVDTSKVTGEVRTVTRRDGSSQLAIGDWPLYTAERGEPGDIIGHGSSGSWYAVGPDGTLYRE